MLVERPSEGRTADRSEHGSQYKRFVQSRESNNTKKTVGPQRASHKWFQSDKGGDTSQRGYKTVSTGIWYERPIATRGGGGLGAASKSSRSVNRGCTIYGGLDSAWTSIFSFSDNGTGAVSCALTSGMH